MKRISWIASVWLGISIGALVSAGFGLAYIAVLHEPGSAFYLFAGLTFLGGSFVGGIVAALKTQSHRRRAFLLSCGAVFGIAGMLCACTYLVLPQFARTNVQLPPFCDGFNGSLDLPSYLAYVLPDNSTGILITGDAQSAVVVTIDSNDPPFPTTVFLVNKSDNRIIWSTRFGNDVVSAAIDEGVAYIYNDKLGYFIDARTGEFAKNFLSIDNYGGLTETDRPIISRASSGHWYMETTAVISSWNVDGSVKSRPHLTFNGIAMGCFISGETGDVAEL